MDKHREKKEQKKKVRPGRKKRMNCQQKWLVTIAVILAVALVMVLAYKALFVRPDVVSKPGTSEPEAEDAYIDYGDGIKPKADGQRKSEDFYTVLILGRDTGGGGNTDTMLLASYDVTNQKATVMSIPRDTMVNIPYDIKRINAVYNYGGGGEKGIKALYKEISQLVGFEPDYQVVVEWDAVGQIVDAMGGVWFDVPRDMNYEDPYQDLSIHQTAGYRLLSGDDAMQVLRYRHDNKINGVMKGYADGDLGRIKTQQALLKAMVSQLLKLENLAKVNQFAKVFQENVETDLSFQNILWFAKSAYVGGLSVENVNFVTMPNKTTSAWSRNYKNNQSYVVPIASELLDLVNNSLSPFVEPSTLSDLDIMSVNADGSVSSTTGHVEDSVAAAPPVKAEPEKTEPTYEFDDYGNVIDPMNGNVLYYVDAEGNLIDAATGEVAGNLSGTQEPTGPSGTTDEIDGSTGAASDDVIQPIDPEDEQPEGEMASSQLDDLQGDSVTGGSLPPTEPAESVYDEPMETVLTE